MMKLLTAAQMRKLDETAIKDMGIPGIVLMENASRGLFKVISNEMAPLDGKYALIVCGKGNNGGDGFAVARYLLNAGATPEVVLGAKPADIKGDAKTNMEICVRMGIPVISITEAKKLSPLRNRVKKADLLVDALLGTGVKGEVKPFYLKIIKAINNADCPVFAVDVPSGISVDEGRVYNGAVEADHTATFGAAKIGLFVHPAAEKAGSVYVVDIGIPRSLLDETEPAAYLTTLDYVSRIFTFRTDDVHKGDCGKVLIVGGSRGMSGATILAGEAALRTGTGLIYLAVPRGLNNIIERKFTEAITLPQDEDSRGRLALSAAGAIVDKLEDVDAVVLGPGISVTDGAQEIVERVVEECRVPLLIDADGLNCIARDPDVLNIARAPVVLTPHPGEMARLTGKKISDVQAARFETARDFAMEYSVIVVLKGPNSLIATPDGAVYVNPTGNGGMATAGSGDVLSGIIGSLLGEGMEPELAAMTGVYLHGMAGDAAASESGRRSMIASDIVSSIASAVRKIYEAAV